MKNKFLKYLYIGSHSQIVFLSKYFNAKRINYYKNENVIELKSSDLSKTITIDLLRIYNLKIEKNKQNIFSESDFKSYPYYREFLEISLSGKLLVRKDKKNFSFLYFPSHPKSIKKGIRKGYLKTTNVNIQKEIQSLMNNVRFYNHLVSYMKIKYPDVYVNKKNDDKYILSILLWGSFNTSNGYLNILYDRMLKKEQKKRELELKKILKILFNKKNKRNN